ncbi:hypothetical protein ITI46_30455 [Streptomyces oryzae]|uniref:Aromatic ring-opening dioxygenase LigA n=1 Tax=Streptomyces oryzae TaxID=1434886 RepID=A0ABS3XLS9_9ACTN|nr:hypothetical protein [Streptomyces oryzae]MBO8195937.1 hypothetical protein [Streptomyces oryzae]
MSEPLIRTLLLLDVERYSNRDDVEQVYLRRTLYDVADRALDAAGIDDENHRRADRGDGLIELIDANASVASLLRVFLTEVPASLRAVNRMASSSAQIRLRAVLASGYVAIDATGGWVGSDLNHAARLLDCDELRDALRERDNDLALCVSDPVYSGIVRHSHPGIPAEEFHHIAPGSKNGTLSAWLFGPPAHSAPPGRSASCQEPTTAQSPEPADSAQAPAPAQAPAAPAGGITFNGSAHIGGSVVGGDQYGVSGGTVHGDIRPGGAAGAEGERADGGEAR